MMSDRDISDIIQKGKGKMPAFPLAPADLAVMMRYLRSVNLNAAAAESTVPGDAKAGESIFFGDGQCASCHLVRGRGSSIGPDLSSVANRLRAAYLKQAFVNPGANITTGYGSVTVVLNDGSKLQGFARAEGSHDLVLQTKDRKLRLLLDSEYRSLVRDKTLAMPAYQGTEDQQRDLFAFLATLKGVGVGAMKEGEPQPRSTR
jgi:putative heme-binding domain-containing protein